MLRLLLLQLGAGGGIRGLGHLLPKILQCLLPGPQLLQTPLLQLLHPSHLSLAFGPVGKNPLNADISD